MTVCLLIEECRRKKEPFLANHYIQRIPDFFFFFSFGIRPVSESKYFRTLCSDEFLVLCHVRIVSFDFFLTRYT